MVRAIVIGVLSLVVALHCLGALATQTAPECELTAQTCMYGPNRCLIPFPTPWVYGCGVPLGEDPEVSPPVGACTTGTGWSSEGAMYEGFAEDLGNAFCSNGFQLPSSWNLLDCYGAIETAEDRIQSEPPSNYTCPSATTSPALDATLRAIHSGCPVG